jgi:D-3-phosphoglycerate dehydrogenase / 2-oxoglutarate reductase
VSCDREIEGSIMDIKNYRILVTPTSYGKADVRLLTELDSQVGEVIYNPTSKPLPSAEVARLLPGIDGYIAGLDQIDNAALGAADKLKVIARYGVGVDNVDLEAARTRGICVTNTPGANSVSVAELTIGLILSLARRIPEAVSATRAGGWPRMTGLSLEGKTIGLLGLGAIGKQVVNRLAGFACRLMAYDPVADAKYAWEKKVILASMDEVISQADFLSLHLPLLPETRNLVNAGFLAKMKKGAYLINTARGELIDESALAEAVRQEHLAGAALDVFTQEPPEVSHPLLSLPQVLVTPHTASHTDGAMNTMGWMALQDCLSVLRGESPLYPVK